MTLSAYGRQVLIKRREDKDWGKAFFHEWIIAHTGVYAMVEFENGTVDLFSFKDIIFSGQDQPHVSAILTPGEGA
jgi:hypothetical protein